ncbi:hypothetical protein ACFL6S_18670 [Candidatus Poribacteria bacterium]
MWEPKEIDWLGEYRKLVEALREDRLVVFVGNGVSRLSEGGKSWADLFAENPRVDDALRSRGINLENALGQGASLLEIAQVVSENPIAWNSLRDDLKEWSESASPNLIHRIITQVLKPVSIVTTNFDILLEKACGTRVRHIHGDILNPILSEEDYFSKFREVENILFDEIGGERVLLFIGYGHSYNDFDILSYRRDIQRFRTHTRPCYSLISNNDDTPLVSTRLERFGVAKIVYTLPRNPKPKDRILALGTALIKLRKDADPDFDVPNGVNSEIEGLEEKNREKNQRTSFVIGLSSASRVSEPERFPRRRRMSIPTKEWEEAAGPGFITAKMLAVLGHQVALVSKTGQDDERNVVCRALERKYVKDEVTVDLDYLDESEDGDEVETWRSYVIVESVKNGPRVILDRRWDHREKRLDSSKREDSRNAIKNHETPLIFFDRFLAYDVRDILRGLRQGSWTVYETGTNGDRYEGYELERNVLQNLVNIAVASFPFARDFLAKDQGSLNDTLYSRLGGRGRSEEATSAAAERKAISKLLKNPRDLKSFTRSISEGAKEWLRESDPRLVIVTLHEKGCIWVKLDPFDYGHVAGIKVVPQEDKWYTNMAGDIFRAVFTAAIMEVRNRKLDINAPAVIRSICEISNKVASEKIRFPTFKKTITDGEVKEFFKIWKCGLTRLVHPANIQQGT